MTLSTAFTIASALAVLAALVAVTRKNPIHAALFTAAAMGAVAVCLLLLHSPFLAAMQVLLYAGAIMVLFVFVIMLLSLKREELGDEPGEARKGFAFACALAVFALAAYPAWVYRGREGVVRAPVPRVESAWPRAADGGLAPPSAFGSTEHFGQFLYTEGLVPFELVSILLLAALAGVVILAKKRVAPPSQPPPASPGEGNMRGAPAS
jgi:NADH-quinone oxidoreductase subunit J